MDDQLFAPGLGDARTRLSRRSFLRRSIAAGFSMLALPSLLAACGGGQAPDSAVDTNGTSTSRNGSSEDEGNGTGDSRSKELIIALHGSIADFDPQSAYSFIASTVFLASYEMLVRFKGESTSEFEPMLARSWEVNDDATEISFTLAEGATFHDGTACDAEAVKESFTRFLHMGRGPVGVISRFVEDADAQIEVVDPTTIKFIMTQPQPLFVAAMASSYGPFVVSPAAMAEHKTDNDEHAHEWFSQNMVGTGPYKQVEIAPQERVVLERFEDYHSDPPFFERVIFRVIPEDASRRQLIEAGEIDGLSVILPEDRKALAQNSDIQIIEYESTETDWVRMNHVRIPDPRVRRAFAYAFPYQEVIDQVLGGFATVQGPIADTVLGYDPNIPVYTTDLDQAKALLDEAGLDESENFTFMYGAGDATPAAIAQLFQANLATLGVSLEIEQVDQAAFLSLNYGDTPGEERPHFSLDVWWPDYNDPWTQLYPNFHSDSRGSSGANSGFYSNAEVDRLLDQMAVATSEEETSELTSKVVQILMWDDPAAIFYAQIRNATVLRADIDGFVPNGIYIASYNFSQMRRV